MVPISIAFPRVPARRVMPPTIARRGRAPRRRCATPRQGAHVALVSGGDPGVFAMAAAVCEQIESGDEIWRKLDVAIVPGVTAMLAVAARVGAPLGHDFCAISLSDNLKPWELIERRLDAAAGAGFVIALYNPISRARPWQLGKAFERLRRHLPASTPVIFGRAIGRPDEKVLVCSLDAVDPSAADMATLIIVGSSQTRVIERPGLAPLIYTPRSAEGSAAHDRARRTASCAVSTAGTSGKVGRRSMMTSMPSARAAAILP